MTLTATVAYPYLHADRTAQALRGELRHQSVAKDVRLDWSTLTVEGPREATGAHGRTCFVWDASVGARP